MISRKRILSNSCSQLSRSAFAEDEDAWFDVESLIRDHIQEVLSKCDQLDDEIWGKIICMERNRRIAKAYARSPVININGGSIGFDGDCIGLSGFDNPYRDSDSLSITRRIGSEGFFVAADEEGNVLLDVNRCRSRIHLKNASTLLSSNQQSPRSNKHSHYRRQRLPSFRQSTSRNFSNSFKKTEASLSFSQKSGVSLTFGRTHKIFDMKTFLKGLNQELLLESHEDDDDDGHRVHPILLSSQCISIISFDVNKGSVMNDNTIFGDDLLETPVWIMIINVIALEMLHKNLNSIYHLNDTDSMESPSSRRPTMTSSKSHRRSFSGSRDDLMPLKRQEVKGSHTLGSNSQLHHRNNSMAQRNSPPIKPLRRGNSTASQIMKRPTTFKQVNRNNNKFGTMMSRSNSDLFDNTYHLEDQLHFGNDSRLVGVKGKALGGGCSSRGSVGTLMLDSKQHKRVDRKQDLKGWVDNNVEDDDVLPTPDYDSDNYRSIFNPLRRKSSSFESPRGFLNSVLRHLPLNASLAVKADPSEALPAAYQESWRRLPDDIVVTRMPSCVAASAVSSSGVSSSSSSNSCDYKKTEVDSDESLTHIYSSISETTASGRVTSSKDNRQNVRRLLKRTTSHVTVIPRTLRNYFLKKGHRDSQSPKRDV